MLSLVQRFQTVYKHCELKCIYSMSRKKETKMFYVVSARVRPIPVLGIGRYSPVLVSISIGRYLLEYRRRYQ